MRYAVFLLFIACATFVPKNINQAYFQTMLTAQCLSGSGSGRIEMGGKRYGFDFQSLLEKENHWVLAIDIPFRGEEVLEITRQGKRYLFRGSFYRMLRAGYQDYQQKNPKLSADSLNKFLAFMASELFNFRKFQKMSASSAQSYFGKWCKAAPAKRCQWRMGHKAYVLQPDLWQVNRKLENFDLVWVNDQLASKQKFFRRSEIALNSEQTNLLKVTFYWDRCQNETTEL